MEKSGFKRTKLLFLFESVIYICFFILDITRQNIFLSGILKYTGIILCAVYVWTAKEVESDCKYRIFKLAYAFLLIADIFLLFTENYLPGLLAFVFVQSCYAYYLNEGRKKEIIFRSVFCLGMTIGISVLLLLSGIKADYTLVVAILYFSLFLNNIIKAVRNYYYKKENFYFIIGLLFYFLCDLNVGIYQASFYFEHNLPNQFIRIAEIGMWLFYLPGQTLIAYSSVSEK